MKHCVTYRARALVTAFAVCGLLLGVVSPAHSEIVVGRTLALSGPLAAYGVAKQDGADALIARVNRDGGVNGKQIRVITLDDAYLPARTVANLKQLADEQRPVAFLGTFGVPTVAAALPVFAELKIPAVGVTSGTAAVRAGYQRYVFPVRASYADEARLIVSHLKVIGLTQVAVIQQDIPFGQAARDIFVAELKAAGITAVAEAKVTPTGDNAAVILATIKKAQPQAVFLAMLSNAAVPVLRELNTQLRGVSSYSYSTIDTTMVMKQTEGAAKGLGVTQIVPIPSGASMLVVRDYRRDLEALKRGEPSFYGLEAYLEAAVLVEGLKRTGSGNPSSESLVKALETMNAFEIKGFRVSYSGRGREGSRYVDLTVIGKNGVMH